MVGRFSGEWLALVVVLATFAAFVGRAAIGLHPMWALPVFAGVYGLLRLAGRTPIGITYESDPAARGHPLLSLLAAVMIAVLAVRAGLASVLGTGE